MGKPLFDKSQGPATTARCFQDMGASAENATLQRGETKWQEMELSKLPMRTSTRMF